MKRTLIELRLGRHAVKRLKVGEWQITLKLDDAPAQALVEVIKGNEPHMAGYLSPAGLFTFEDEIKGLNPITYKITVNDQPYGTVTVYPIVVDAGEVLDDAFSLTKSILTNVIGGGGRWLRP